MCIRDRLYVFSNVLNFTKALRSIYQNVRYFIRSKKCVLNFASYIFFVHTKRNYDKNNNWQSTCHLFVSASEFTEAKKLAIEWFGPESGYFLTLESFATKTVLSRLPRPWSSEACVFTLMGPSNQNAIKGVPDQLLKERLWCLWYPAETLHF